MFYNVIHYLYRSSETNNMYSFSFLFSYVFRDIFKNRSVFTFVVSSLAVASVAIIMTSSILLGFQNMLTSGNQGWLSDIVVSSQNDATPSIRNVENLIKNIESLSGVESTSVRSYANTIITYNERTMQPFRIIGIDAISEKGTTLLHTRTVSGEYLHDTLDSDEIVIGLTFADSLIGSSFDGSKPKIGEYLTFTTRDGGYKKYRIRGIIDAKTFLPNLLVIFQKDELEKLGISDNDAEIVVRITEGASIENVMRNIRKLNPDIRVRSSEEESGFVGDIITTVNFITGSIRTTLVISIFLIINVVFYISVTQKRRQIGIMKSMGAPNRFIVNVYLLEAICYAVLSFIVGILIFYIILSHSAANPTPLLIGDFSLAISKNDVVVAGVITGIASIAGSLLPAYIAAKTKIADVLRNTI